MGAFRTVYTGLALAVQVPGILARLLIATCPTTALSGVASRSKLVVWSEAVPLQDIKRVAKATDSTVNDVLVSALSGALHRYQLHHDGDAVDVPTMIPVNLRPLEEPLESGLGNRFAVVILGMPSGLQTPEARFRLRRSAAWTRSSSHLSHSSPSPSCTASGAPGATSAGFLRASSRRRRSASLPTSRDRESHAMWPARASTSSWGGCLERGTRASAPASSATPATSMSASRSMRRQCPTPNTSSRRSTTRSRPSARCASVGHRPTGLTLDSSHRPAG